MNIGQTIATIATIATVAACTPSDRQATSTDVAVQTAALRQSDDIGCEGIQYRIASVAGKKVTRGATEQMLCVLKGKPVAYRYNDSGRWATVIAFEGEYHFDVGKPSSLLNVRVADDEGVVLTDMRVSQTLYKDVGYERVQ